MYLQCESAEVAIESPIADRLSELSASDNIVNMSFTGDGDSTGHVRYRVMVIVMVIMGVMAIVMVIVRVMAR
jgi:hypothetical protein